MSRIEPTLRLFMAVSTATLIALLLITAGAGYRLEMGLGKLIFAPPEPARETPVSRSLPSKAGPGAKDVREPEPQAGY